MSNWDKICQYLLHAEESKDIHKMVWPSAEEAYLSGIPYKRNGLPYGRRIKITPDTTLDDVIEIVKWVNLCNVSRDKGSGLSLYQ